MRKSIISGLLAGTAGLLTLPGVTFAQTQAYTNSPVNLYSGPADDYPAVSQLPGGVPVTVMGCVSGYTWCDVALPDLRGWVYAGNLSYPYQGSNVPILNYGTVIGLPIVTFSIGAYWGSYYRGRPWYNDQARWAHHQPPPPGRGGPPPGHGGPPPGHGGPPPGHGGPPPGHGGPPPGHGGPPPGHGGPPPEHGGPPPGGGHPPPEHVGQPPGRGGPPPGRVAAPQERGAPPQQAHGGAPQQHGGPPQGHGGAPQEHGGGGGGHENHEQHNN
jgi:uncharacterized protein YraI